MLPKSMFPSAFALFSGDEDHLFAIAHRCQAGVSHLFYSVLSLSTSTILEKTGGFEAKKATANKMVN